MKKTYFLALILLAISSFGCQKNITLDIPKYSSKVVVYCVLRPDSLPSMSLTLSQSYYSYADTTGKPVYIANAHVTIIDQNTNIVDTLNLDTVNNQFKFYFGKHRPIQGHHYIANINYQGKIITAQTTLPMAVKIDHIDYTKINSLPFTTDSSYVFALYFNDIPGETDNYTVTQASPFYYEATDYYGFTSDAGQDGKQIELFESLYHWDGVTPTAPFNVDFMVDNATKETADYFSNLLSQSNSANNPFSQPVIVKGNINGGLGLFGAMTPSPSVTVKVVK